MIFEDFFFFVFGVICQFRFVKRVIYVKIKQFIGVVVKNKIVGYGKIKIFVVEGVKYLECEVK